MTNRVEELLLQLEQIDYRNSSNLSVSNQSKHDNPIKEQESFKQGLKSLLSSPGLQDDSLKTELQDLQTQLKILSIQKKKEKINNQKQCSNIDKQVSAHKEELEKIEKQLGSLEDKADNVEKIIKEKQDEKLEAFRYALKPLEETSNTILEEKQFLMKKKEDLSARVNEILSKRASKTDELKSLLFQRAEYFSNREKLQVLLTEIKEKEPYNFKEYLHEIETREILSAIKNRKSKQTSELKEIEKKLAEIEGLIEKTSEDHEQKAEVPEKIEQGIEDLENYLNL